MRLLTIAIAFLSIAVFPTCAAEISIISMQYSATHPVPHLHYEGDTAVGDIAALEGLYNSFVNCRESCSGPDGMPTAVLTMNGPGGSYLEGLGLADFLRQHHIATVVERGSYCYSACAFAFLGGSAWSSQEGMGTYIDRMIEPGSTVGFHAPYADEESFRAAVEANGGMAAQGQTRDALSIMVKELVKWNVDPEVIFKMVGMGPDESYDLKTAEDLYLARVALPPTRTSGWVIDTASAVRNACLRLLAIDERGDPLDMSLRVPSGFTENIGKAEYSGALSGYVLGDRLLDFGNCAVTEQSLATDGDYEIALYFTPGIDGYSGAATGLFNRQKGWSTAGVGRVPAKRILTKGPLNSYFLPLDQDIDSLDLPGEADIDANRFNVAAPPVLPVTPADFVLDATNPTSRISHLDNVFVFERVGPPSLFESARDKPTLGRTFTNDTSNEVSFVRSGTYDDTGISFSWYGILNGDSALVVEAIVLPEDGSATATEADIATLLRVGCEFDFNGMKLGCD
ncbi:hypothetical protein [Devosia sp. CN2-171]|uniref:COG3904 family protein n=1 Tax=Devosia sp. CN2-171 TaxID=3400909 RepID=UPI003BF78FDA